VERTISCTDLEDISESFDAALKDAKDDDRVVLSIEQARALAATINELWEEVTQHQEAAAPHKPLFLHITKPVNLYLNPGAIALIGFDQKSGNAVVNLINGTTLQVEALQWQMIKKQVESLMEIVEAASTSLVRA
jgi:hypothetical protein